MILSILKIFPLNEKRQEVLDILLSVKGPTLAAAGCQSCCIYEEYNDEQSLVFIEQWQSLRDLERHICSSNYVRILEAMELSASSPDLSFHETGQTWNFELVESVRSQAHHSQSVYKSS